MVVGRAEAAGTLVTSGRATADLQVATRAARPLRLDADGTDRRALCRPHPGDAREQASARRECPMRPSERCSWTPPWRVHRWSNAGRDDTTRHRSHPRMHEAVRDDAKNTDSYEAGRRFLYQHRDVPTVWNGPRGGGEQYGHRVRPSVSTS